LTALPSESFQFVTLQLDTAPFAGGVFRPRPPIAADLAGGRGETSPGDAEMRRSRADLHNFAP
jgi:hypothetical protein